MNEKPVPLLEIANLSVSYGGIEALQNINIAVNVGEVVTLIGANGAGKARRCGLFPKSSPRAPGKLFTVGATSRAGNLTRW